MSDTLLEQTPFRVLGERAELVLGEVLDRIPPGASWRVLDLGCATGEAVIAIAAERPAAHVVGVDVSAPSIATAREAVATHPARDRIELFAGDYRAADLGGPFDVIVADQVLHLVPGSTEALADRLAADLRAGGLLFAEMPHDALYNRAMAGVRRVLRAVRNPALDRAGLALAKRLHGGDMPAEQLQERLVYVYVPPERLAGARFDALLAERGLRLVARRPMAHAGAAQLRHRLSVYRREAA